MTTESALGCRWLPVDLCRSAWLPAWLPAKGAVKHRRTHTPVYQGFSVEAKGLEPSNLLTASQALYQLSYAPEGCPTLIDLTGSRLTSTSTASWPAPHAN